MASLKDGEPTARKQSAVLWEHDSEEVRRLVEDKQRKKNWKRWGPYLSERQWGTVREDYSADGSCWDYLPHDHSRSRAYRWGEDGLLGITDRECRLCFALALWNEKDPILKERLFGLTGTEGNHGEDVKECYYYLDSTPTHSYMKALYKYPQKEFPYSDLLHVNRQRGKTDSEFELSDTAAFNDNCYWDITAEYAKNTPNDILVNITVANRGAAPARLHLLPTLWFRNTWIWGCKHEGCTMKALIKETSAATVQCKHETLGKFTFTADVGQDGKLPSLLFTENETNSERLFNFPTYTNYTKDAFHRYLIRGEKDAVSPNKRGTKVAAHYLLEVPSGGQHTIRCRLSSLEETVKFPFDKQFSVLVEKRRKECDDFYKAVIPATLSAEEQSISRQAYAGLLWSKQFYHYIVKDWLDGDPEMPTPPSSRLVGRNAMDWKHLFNRDIVSMPDKWEYPWYASWDLAFHMLSFVKIDPEFAKQQLMLFLREWYMAPNGQIPAYEFALSDVNPPVHAWACIRVYKMSATKGKRDQEFLARCFQKLLLNFTWWVNRKDPDGKNIFGGGFLGLDNIGIFDRSKPLPIDGRLAQADGTAWMAFYCVVMLNIALDLAVQDHSYEDMASKFFEHFTHIADAMNEMSDGLRLWDEEDGFYYDHIQHSSGYACPLRVRSLVGLVPLLACLVLDDEYMNVLPGFRKRLNWFMENRKDLASQVTFMDKGSEKKYHHLLAIPTKDQLRRMLSYMLDENEFLSPYGIRSVSKYHKDHPLVVHLNGQEHRVDYVPGESNTYMFGGNSNWRGPVWFPLNFCFVEALERYDYFYGDSFKVECPTGSGNLMRLREVSQELSRRLVKLFLPDENGRRPCHGNEVQYATNPHWRELVLFYEYFDPDTGRGCGASHQTGWTALVTRCLDKCASSG